MNIQTLYLRNFRNYETAQLALSPGVNVFCGENAQGKTNILEAVGLLSTTRLFRSGQKRDAVRFGAQQAEVRAAFFAEKRDRTVRAVIPQAGRAQFFVNEVKQKRLSDVTGVLRTVLFCPEDCAVPAAAELCAVSVRIWKTAREQAAHFEGRRGKTIIA